MTPFYYCYIYRDPRTGDPFYVGKGKNYRAHVHLRRVGPNIILRNKITGLQRAGLKPTIDLFPCPDEATAFALEAGFIQAFGRRHLGTGPLLNYTAGGEGASGRLGMTHTPEAKARIAAKLKGRTISPETRAKMRDAAKRRTP